MQRAIFSDRERVLLTKFLSNEPITDETFRMLKLRVRRNYQVLSEDYQLISQVMNKLESSKLT
jgi:hypothetical protein